MKVREILQTKGYETKWLQNVLHMAFFNAVKKRVTAFVALFETMAAALPGKLREAYSDLIMAIADEDEKYLLASASAYTAAIAQKDAQRDELYSIIARMVQMFYQSTLDAEKHAAAEAMMEKISLYKVDVRASYEVETTQIQQWLQAQTGSARLTKAAETLGLSAYVTQLATVNEEMRQLVSLRMDEQGAVPAEALKQARTATDEAWESFQLALNAYAIIDEDPERFDSLLQALNEEIAYSKDQHEQLRKKNAKIRAEKKKKDDDGGEDE